jgi:hypothetical protein
MAVEAYYLVVVNEDGGVTTYTELPEELPKANRVANTADVYATSRQIVDEFDRTMLSNKVVSDLMKILAPVMPPAPEPSVPERLKDALKKRNINPESIEPVN